MKGQTEVSSAETTKRVLEDISRILEQEKDAEKKKTFVRSVIKIISDDCGSVDLYEQMCKLLLQAFAKKRSSIKAGNDLESQAAAILAAGAPPEDDEEEDLGAVDNDTTDPLNDPSMWCLTLDQLNDIGDGAEKVNGSKWYEKATMHQVVESIAVPYCRRTGKGFWHSKNPKGLKVTVFVTHSWKENFKMMLKSINAVFKNSLQKPNLWICAFALIQGDYEMIKAQVGGPSPSLRESPFVRALAKAEYFLVVRNSACDNYSRIWCVCELIFAMEFKLVPSKTFITGPDTFANSKISCLEAEASVEEDKDRILQHLTSTMSPEEVDEKISEFRQLKLPTQETKLSFRMKVLIGSLSFLLVAVAVIVPVVLTIPSTEEKIQRIIESEFPTINKESYQGEAFAWLVNKYQSKKKKIEKGAEIEILEKYTLSSIYYSTGGNGWKNQGRNESKWLSSDDICRWYGVNCTNNKISELRLPHNDLKRSIPDEIEYLQSLTAIDFSSNSITRIPESIGGLQQLEVLDFSSNNITRIPESIGGLQQLEVLNISSNSVTRIPETIASLSSLTSLWLFNNELTGPIPKEIKELMVTLQQKYYNIILEKIPMSKSTIYVFGTAQYQSFQTIAHRIENGDIAFREDDLWQRYVLTVLYYNNGGNGWFTNCLSSGDYCNWEYVGCNKNNDVDELWLSNNNLNGTIPAELAALTMLTYLSFSGNSLTGTIPTEIGNLVALKELYLYGNQLTGTIPSNIGKLTKLRYLSLSRNKLSGTIPTLIGELRELTTLYLRDNKLTGTIPRQFEKLTNLKYLWLNGNDLTGNIPEVLCPATRIDIDCDKVTQCSCCRDEWGNLC